MVEARVHPVVELREACVVARESRSATSGRPGSACRAWSAGTGASGTSSSGRLNARRPGRERSLRVPWVRGPPTRTGAPPSRGQAGSAPSRVPRSREHLLERHREAVDLLAGAAFGDGHQQAWPSASGSTPPRYPRSISASRTSAAGRGSRIGNSLKNGASPNSGSTPGPPSDAPPRTRPSTRAAELLEPLGPSHPRYTVAAIAISVWFVQMLEVAFSRRMCCSRACSVRTYPVRPSTSSVSPTSLPGSRRTSSRRVAITPRYGPPWFRWLPSTCPSPPRCPRAGHPVGRARRATAGRRPGSRAHHRRAPPRTAREPARAGRTRWGAGRHARHVAGHLGLAAAPVDHVEDLGLVPRSPAVGPQGLDVPRVDGGAHEHPLAARRGSRQVHGLGERRRAVVQRRVRDLEPGQLADHRLVLEQACSTPWESSGWYGV